MRLLSLGRVWKRSKRGQNDDFGSNSSEKAYKTMENHRKEVKMIKKGSKRAKRGQNDDFGRVWYGFGRFWLCSGSGERDPERSLRGGPGRVYLSYHLTQVSNCWGRTGSKDLDRETSKRGQNDLF